ncbi:hypothetical protein LZZ85_02750 [Terrimonas sp. NA20]|uniref:Uncharacterized protein n=1 Tax=Terrimonas ginsenosidimutans TaxID=2908004 RepID=A0ABS9KLI6_9BACT|nr:hypothetical protein [Terrimonas ginsenosidimutans]MCG2613175.1 hypothetical protein [Terrimonas ginsenosidimutans]
MKFKKIGRMVAEFRVNGRNGLVECGKFRFKRWPRFLQFTPDLLLPYIENSPGRQAFPAWMRSDKRAGGCHKPICVVCRNLNQ